MVHQAFVAVEKTGTEAAASTAGVMVERAMLEQIRGLGLGRAEEEAIWTSRLSSKAPNKLPGLFLAQTYIIRGVVTAI